MNVAVFVLVAVEEAVIVSVEMAVSVFETVLVQTAVDVSVELGIVFVAVELAVDVKV